MQSGCARGLSAPLRSPAAFEPPSPLQVNMGEWQMQQQRRIPTNFIKVSGWIEDSNGVIDPTEGEFISMTFIA